MGLVAASPLWKEVKSRGYRLVSFSTTYVATRDLPEADLQIPTFRRRTTPTAETLRLNSVAGALWRGCGESCSVLEPTPFPVEDSEGIEAKFQVLRSLPDSAGPIWAFLHVLAPHEPFVFEENCDPRTPWWPLNQQLHDAQAAIRAAYRNQVDCVDSLLLSAVTEIVTRSRTPPVIVIAGDHGYGRIALDAMHGVTLEYAQLDATQLAERMTVFSAIRLPQADSALDDDISLIEIMPTVRRGLWNDTVSIRRDAPSYWSPYQRLTDFVEVPPSLLLASPRPTQ